MSQCKHLDSMWGRCTSCGMTWDEQARRRKDKRSNVSAMVRAVEDGERFTIERSGEPVAVVIPYAERERLREAADRLT